MIEAADLLENFCTYWKACVDVDKPDEARYQLVSKIVDRVFVYNDQIIGVVLHGDFAVVLGENTTAPEENSDAAEWETISQSLAKFLRSQCGSDGVRSNGSIKFFFSRHVESSGILQSSHLMERSVSWPILFGDGVTSILYSTFDINCVRVILTLSCSKAQIDANGTNVNSWYSSDEIVNRGML